jgi:uncharacterized protein (DUF1800 family)
MAQQADLVAAVKKGTAELTAADRNVAQATAALIAARSNLDVARFNSPAYNARVTAQQVVAAKEKYEKAAGADKEQALEEYELAQELAAQRKTDLENAQKLLPQREAEAASAEEKYLAALRSAQALADRFKVVVRQDESEAQARLESSKQALEKAAVAKSAAEQHAASVKQVSKLFAESRGADTTLKQAVEQLERATGEGRSEKEDVVEQAIKAAAAALHAAAIHLPGGESADSRSPLLTIADQVVAAEQNLQKAKAALTQARKDAEDKAGALTQAKSRVQAAEQALEKRTAKVRAQKDLQREQQSLERAVTAKQEADRAAPQKSKDVDQAQRQLDAALAAAEERLLSTESAASVLKEREAIDKRMVNQEGALKREQERLVQAAAATLASAQQAEAAAKAADKLLAERQAVRDALERTMRLRFVRQARAASDERRQAELALAEANRELQPRVGALNRAVAGLKPLQDAAKKARQEADAAATVAAKAASAAKAAEQKAAEAQTLVSKATGEKEAVERKIAEQRKIIDAAPAKAAVVRAGIYGGLKPLTEKDWSEAKARHLLVRAGFGGTTDDVARLHARGLFGAVNHLVNFKDQPAANIEFDAAVKERPESFENALVGEEQRRLRENRVAKDRQQIQNMRLWWMQRMIESPRPLEEKLTLFWHGHFACQYSDVGDSYYMYLQNQLFRDHAAGNFGTLLYGIAHDAAMLKYLNNDTNVKGRANENLAREIMELFGMGRDQGYSETDIRQGARALTGYTYDVWTGQFRFVSARHDTDPKKIFGKEGNWNGDDFVQLILETPYPAKFIARQAFVFFAHEEPSPDTIEALANVLRLNNYELSPMLENLFLSEEFYSPRTMGTQVKGPIQLIVGLHRDLGLKQPDLPYLVSAARDMGQELFEPPSVFGWQAGHSWISTSRTFSRYNALAEIVERRPRGGKTGVDVVGTLLKGKKLGTHAEVIDYLVKSCLTVPPSAEKRQALIEFISALPAPSQWEANAAPVNARLTRLLVMLMCSPEYQLN